MQQQQQPIQPQPRPQRLKPLLDTLDSMVLFGSRRTRRITRGDFGLMKAPQEPVYPRQTAGRTLQSLTTEMKDNIFCNPSADPQKTPYDTRRRLTDLQIPDDQKCLASVVLESQKLIQESKEKDRRTLRLPRGTSTQGNQAYYDLNRTEKAKKHLDKARQMYWSGSRFMGIALGQIEKANREQIQEQKSRLLKQAKKNLEKANTTIGVSSDKKTDKTSALWELYTAYQLIRDYEVNPLRPLDDNGLVNLNRVAEDKGYIFIMGTNRMTPNRLGLDQHVRQVWFESGYPDPNWLPRNRGFGPDILYRNVESRFGPVDVQALWDFETYEGRTGLPNIQGGMIIKTQDELQALGIPSRELIPDTGHALLDIHRNMQPPVQRLLGPLQIIQSNQPPPPLSGNPYAIPGQNGAIFFPSGKSRGPYGPPYDPIEPTPLYGVPSRESGIWDARYSANMLKSAEGKLAHEMIAQSSLAGRQDRQNREFWPAGPLKPIGFGRQDFDGLVV